jgi:Region found in RelA / SpoT proteins
MDNGALHTGGTSLQEHSYIVECLRNALGDDKCPDIEKIVKSAIALSDDIAKQRGMKKPRMAAHIKAEDTGFEHDPCFIPNTLVGYVGNQPASVLAAILFSVIRPFGSETAVHDESWQKIKKFVSSLDKTIYGGVVGIIQNALQIRAIPRPRLKRKTLCVDDIRAQPTDAQVKRNEYYCRLVMRTTTDKPALVIRLVQQYAKLKHRLPLDELNSEEERQSLLRELYHVRHFYAPMAEKLGLRQMTEDMQDHILRLADPDMHGSLHLLVRDHQQSLVDTGNTYLLNQQLAIAMLCEEIKHQVETQTQEPVQVYGRLKKPFSTWIKMAEKKTNLANVEAQIFDITGITVESTPPKPEGMKPNQYRMLEHESGRKIVEALKGARRGRKFLFEVQKLTPIKRAESDAVHELVECRDYVQSPKPNGYAAKHMRLRYLPGGYIVRGYADRVAPIIDMHIVTTAQNKVNKTAASHAAYKARGGRSDVVCVADQWGPAANEVFVMTPTGEIQRVIPRGLVEGSAQKHAQEVGTSPTVADFAARVSTDLAARAVSAELTRHDPFDVITGMQVPMHHRPCNGDIIKINEGPKSLAADSIQHHHLLSCMNNASNRAALKRHFRKSTSQQAQAKPQ